MNKVELKQIEKLKREYLKHKQIADEIFNRSKYEYEALDVCEKRKGDQAYGYAQGIYQALSILGQEAELPIMS